MPKSYRVAKRECISSIADEHGFFPDTLWNHPQNARLKQRRKDPNVLFEGDEVYIPDKALGTESGSTGQRHRFRKRGVPAKFVLQLLEYGEPRANLDYTLRIDSGESFCGTTDGEGVLECSIPPDARKGILIIDAVEEYELALGKLDPVTEESGFAARLENLGFLSDAADLSQGELEEATRAFQKEHEVDETGKPDSQTMERLREIYGS